MASSQLILILAVFVATSSLVFASDPSPLQDFCVADPNCTGIIFSYNLFYGVLPSDNLH